MSRITAVALLVFVLIFTLLANEKEDLARGKKLYIKQCSKCHRKNGKGIKTVYPPLKNSDYIKNGDKIELLRGMLFGREGKITVNGYTYKGVMTTEIDKSLNDRDIALILNYVYKVLNKSDVITTVKDVKKARKAGKLKSHNR